MGYYKNKFENKGNSNYYKNPKCSICTQIAKTYDFNNIYKVKNDDGFYFIYEGALNLKIRVKQGKFFLVTEWLGCPKYESEVCAISENGDKSEIKINYCPICGKRLSVYRFLKQNKNYQSDKKYNNYNNKKYYNKNYKVKNHYDESRDMYDCY